MRGVFVGERRNHHHALDRASFSFTQGYSAGGAAIVGAGCEFFDLEFESIISVILMITEPMMTITAIAMPILKRCECGESLKPRPPAKTPAPFAFRNRSPSEPCGGTGSGRRLGVDIATVYNRHPTSITNNRQRNVRRVIRVVIDLLVGNRDLRVGSYRIPAVQVPVVAREVRA